MNPVERIDRIVLNTRDSAALSRFYVDGLGFEPIDGRLLGLGDTRLEIREVGSTATPYPDDVRGWDPRFHHFAMAVSDMPRAMALLQAIDGWRPISRGGAVTLPAGAGGVTAFKFRDPDGHPLELIAFPRDQQGDGHPLLRIDHTAISVTDVERSIAFYAGLGLRVDGRTLNAGREQERLDDMDGVTVDVVTLRLPTDTTPHLELLGYRRETDRSPRPLGIDDVAATRIVFAAAREAPARLTRDPDGHVLRFD